MKLVGLTGGVGMGKTTTALVLTGRGLPVVDTDQLAREVVQPGQPALEAIVEAFGDRMLDEEGRLDREAMAAEVFGDEEKRRRLEAIVHPAIRERWQAEVERWRGKGAAAGVVVIPLLFETGAEGFFDLILCSACTRSTQEKRLAERGWEQAHLRQRIDSQLPITEKMAAADYVIWTEAELDVHAAQVDRLLHREGLEEL